MEENRTFTFPNILKDEDNVLESALNFFAIYKSPTEVDALRTMLEAMDGASREDFIKNKMPVMLVEAMFGAPKYLMEDKQE